MREFVIKSPWQVVCFSGPYVPKGKRSTVIRQLFRAVNPRTIFKFWSFTAGIDVADCVAERVIRKSSLYSVHGTLSAIYDTAANTISENVQEKVIPRACRVSWKSQTSRDCARK